MKCPYCQSKDSKVVDSRDADASIRRRRECLNCGRRFTTYERVERASLRVIKRDGRREEFNRDKLIAGVYKSFEKRPVGEDVWLEIVDDVEADLHARPGNEVASDDIAQEVMRRIKEADQIAYIRYASAYRDFADVENLRKELDRLIEDQEVQRAKRDQLPLLSGDEMKRLLESTR